MSRALGKAMRILGIFFCPKQTQGFYQMALCAICPPRIPEASPPPVYCRPNAPACGRPLSIFVAC